MGHNCAKTFAEENIGKLIKDRRKKIQKLKLAGVCGKLEKCSDLFKHIRPSAVKSNKVEITAD